MSQTDNLSLAEFRVLTRAAGIEIAEDELPQVKTIYEHLAKMIAPMREMDLATDDLAVSFTAAWDEMSEPNQ